MHTKSTPDEFQSLVPFSPQQQTEDNLKYPHMKHVNGGRQVIDSFFDLQVHFYCTGLLAEVDIT